jgi:peptidoglycan/LPS O-acetylase OafA/YrhL
LQVPSWFLPFGSDAALWSVAIEFWIYLFVGSIAFIYRDGLSAFRIALLLLFSIVPLQCVTQNNMVLIPWGMGAAIEITINRGLFRKFSLEKLVAGGAIALCIYAARFVEGDGTYNILSYTVLAVAFAAVVECSLRSNPLAITKLIAWCAGWSYSLYLLHHTILIDVADLRYDRTGFAFAILGSIIFSICFAELTEKHHKKLASWIKSKLSSTSEPPARIDPTNRCYGQLTRR